MTLTVDRYSSDQGTISVSTSSITPSLTKAEPEIEHSTQIHDFNLLPALYVDPRSSSPYHPVFKTA